MHVNLKGYTNMSNLGKIFDLIQALQERYGIYTTVTIKPKWIQSINSFRGVVLDVYIADLIFPFNKGVSIDSAFKTLSSLLNDPSEALKSKKQQRIEFLQASIKRNSNEIEELKGTKK